MAQKTLKTATALTYLEPIPRSNVLLIGCEHFSRKHGFPQHFPNFQNKSRNINSVTFKSKKGSLDLHVIKTIIDIIHADLSPIIIVLMMACDAVLEKPDYLGDIATMHRNLMVHLTLYPHARIILCSLLPHPPTFTWSQQPFACMDQILLEIADEYPQADYLDLSRYFLYGKELVPFNFKPDGNLHIFGVETLVEAIQEKIYVLMSRRK